MKEFVKKVLACKLNNVELQSAGKELARLSQELKEMEGQKSRVASEFSARIKSTKCNIEIESLKISTGEQYKEVECEVVRDWDARTKTTIRNDTKEVISTVKMDESEQKELF